MNENWFNAPVTDAERRENFPLTAAVEGSAEQDSRVQTEGGRYRTEPGASWHRVDIWQGNTCIASGAIACVDECEALVRRANAHDEAVELLRGCEDDWQGQLTDTEANTLADRRRAFLAKQP